MTTYSENFPSATARVSNFKRICQMVAELLTIENAGANRAGEPTLSPSFPEYKQASLSVCLIKKHITFLIKSCTSGIQAVSI